MNNRRGWLGPVGTRGATESMRSARRWDGRADFCYCRTLETPEVTGRKGEQAKGKWQGLVAIVTAGRSAFLEAEPAAASWWPCWRAERLLCHHFVLVLTSLDG